METSILFVVPTLNSYLELGELVSSLNDQTSSMASPLSMVLPAANIGVGYKNFV